MLVSANPVVVARQQAVRACVWQVAAIAALAALVAVLAGARAAAAVLVGGGVAISGSAYLAFALFKQRPGAGSGSLVWNVFLSWAVKVVLVISLLAIAFRSKQLPPPFLMAGLCGALAAHWLAMSMAGPQAASNGGKSGSDRDGS